MTFLERLHDEVLIGDGAIGTMLYAKGVSLDANVEHLNLVRPSLVLELHREYLAAGARVIETNTFGANWTRLAAIGLEKKEREINLRGAQLAREAAQGTDAFVAGSVGPLVRMKGDEQELSAQETVDIFRRQTHALAEGEVDLLILETFTDLAQMRHALTAARETGLPVVANMAFLENGRLAGGIEVERVAVELTAAGACVVGANCGAGPLEILGTIQRMGRVTDLPLAAYPNSGFPEYVNGRHVYRTTPDYFADRAVEMVGAGAALVGGCCGTTPEHVRCLAQRLAGLRPAARTVAVSALPKDERRPESREYAGFLARWGREPIVTVELDPPKGLDCAKIIEGSRALREAGADAINIAENPLARIRMGNIALGSLIQREAGIDVIVHVTCRDRNLLGLQSDLMGASLLGIRHVLAVTGDPARIGEQAGATSVYDLNSFGLIKLLADLNAGVNALGSPIGGGTGFVIGAAFNPNSARMEVQVERLARKVANGARFVQTQPLYDVARLEEMAERTAHLGIPILPGILPLVSERNCEFLHNEVPGIVIPEEIRHRMRGKEKEDGVREGLAIAREFIDAVRDRVGGFYLIPPFGKYGIAVELTRYIKGT
ncbi:bifunctional homocysteine S-methyltransferase/methylenetetrahydrofolate reductase [Geobacter sulfurreducens]|jgi:methionine synthase I (cobalamin-dependent)/5,10-methylenetetrahydrofolate reductase|uniref:5-methyltetrahydrofolate--homocysteine S-methyltransferase and 5,10-methylenetetrahydrofolate reductase n=1 Tax=Geobacter sulfurreducens (strain ATCC 51573 / DSM 12127 / PCA) TaxID=243231 RepID=Q748M7_GEOSL|nr:bifunctional homocysteine S-methyltransferase/methylenetetrahydrofolate reductase [Geobacter sulfurreducens]AAR36366.1 5-methyltetrahydrofolate--homocysteine S-methyltransferase and 5,10-methylenetetrahydrofolate reductase [Geobacter sulfurreducens PCA]ADI85728.1 5-methyltetrahydrofolate--homocysteine S-methyltransferase and 5,10-methylenetetrahydrofolate reductase [Geobacter sulfurreducens KN400]AJY69226.1 homocysteine methyltransferase [Geobacter sulfurreducens]QVW34784.1 bifunctional homo